MSIATDISPPAEASPDRPAATGRSWSIVPLLTRLHFYAGVLVAPLLAVAAVTGLLFAFSPQLDGIVHDRELHAAQAWRRLKVPLLITGVLVTAAIGWALPAFGGTLLAFLVLDIAAGLIRRLRRRPPVPTSPAPAGA